MTDQRRDLVAEEPAVPPSGTSDHERRPILERGLLSGVVAIRWGTWAWAVAVFAWEIYDRHIKDDKPDIPRLGTALALFGAAGVFTALASRWWRVRPQQLLRREIVALELLLGGALLAGDGWVWQDVRHSQNLASAWPLAGVLAAGLAFGRRVGLAAGVALGAFAYLSVPLSNGGNITWSLSRISATALFALAGWLAGFVTERLRDSEKRIADARAREEVARTLHDGVLQTLAVVQRRSRDPELSAMAREQEVELRAWLSGGRDRTGGLLDALHDRAARHERHHGTRVTIVTLEELPPLPDDVVEAVSGAVGEALTNATKHGESSTATVFVDAQDDGTLFCSVKDDGSGFDPAATADGIGMSLSIRGRIEAIGGSVEIRSQPGTGAELRLTVPLSRT